MPPLCAACCAGLGLVVDRILSSELLDINQPGQEGYSPLQEAILNDHLALARRLLRQCDDIAVNGPSSVRETPLLLACKRGLDEVVDDMLRFPDLAVTAVDTSKRTAQWYATRTWVV